MARRSRKTDPQPPAADALPICDQCAQPSDPVRGQLTKLWAHNQWRWLHPACRRLLDARMEGKI
jgi:hypothetical protein